MQAIHATASKGRRNDALTKNLAAGIAMLDGRPAEARSLFADARRTWRELGTTFWLALTDLDIVITGAMEPDERRSAAEEAREILTRLQAAALLDRLEKALLAANESTPTARVTPQREEIGQEA